MTSSRSRGSGPARRVIAVLGHAVHVPGAGSYETGGAAADGEPMCTSEEAHTVLGRKGLLAKEPATRLALCAVHRALGLPPGPLAEPIASATRTAVVVSSNLGNLRTVCGIAAAVREESFRAVSPMETPNVSSNVIASTIALRYRFAGPNVMLCNGATSGLDAVRVGARLLRAGRADRVVVVGVEPDDEVARALAESRDPLTYRHRKAPPLRAAAACVILGGRELADAQPGAPVLGDYGMVPPSGDLHTDIAADLLMVPFGWDSAADGLPSPTDPDRVVDLTDRLGETYGALGVLQAAAAAAWLSAPAAAPRPPRSAYLACGDAVEGYSWAMLHEAGDAP